MPTVQITLKKSRTTDKTIAVINGRIKVGEYVNGQVVVTGKPEKSVVDRINHLNKTDQWYLPGNDSPQSIRFPDELKRAIDERAKKENRSFSNMVLTILEKNIKAGE